MRRLRAAVPSRLSRSVRMASMAPPAVMWPPRLSMVCVRVRVPSARWGTVGATGTWWGRWPGAVTVGGALLIGAVTVGVAGRRAPGCLGRQGGPGPGCPGVGSGG
nr:hypothetical protein [Xylella fastidiosa]